MGENRKKWVFTTSSQTDFTTTNLKVFTMSKNLDSTTTRNPRDFTTTNLKDFTTMLDFTMTKKTRAVSTTTSKKTVSTTRVSTTTKKTVSTTTVSTMTDFTTTTIPSKKMVSTTKMVFTMMVRMLSLKRKRAKRPSLSLESQDVNNFVYAT